MRRPGFVAASVGLALAWASSLSVPVGAQVRQYQPPVPPVQPAAPGPQVAPNVSRGTQAQASAPVAQTQQPVLPGVGEVVVFSSLARLNQAELVAVRTLRQVPGLTVQHLVDDQTPQAYLQAFQRLQNILAEGDEFQPDSNGYWSKRYQIEQPGQLVYILPNGTQRVFDTVADVDNLLRLIDRVRQGAPGGAR